MKESTLYVMTNEEAETLEKLNEIAQKIYFELGFHPPTEKLNAFWMQIGVVSTICVTTEEIKRNKSLEEIIKLKLQKAIRAAKEKLDEYEQNESV